MVSIIDIEPVEDKKGYKKVKLSNDDEFIASSESIIKYCLYKDNEYSQDEIYNIVLNIQSDEAFSKAYSFAYNRLRTKKEIVVKLINHGFSDEAIEKTIKRLNEAGLINDKQYAESYVRSAIKLSKKSSKAIIYELVQKGIDRNLAEKILNNFNNEDNIIAYKLLLKKYSHLIKQDEIQYNDIIKMKKFLHVKGFSSENINYAIEKMTGRAYNEDCFY